MNFFAKIWFLRNLKILCIACLSRCRGPHKEQNHQQHFYWVLWYALFIGMGRCAMLAVTPVTEVSQPRAPHISSSSRKNENIKYRISSAAYSNGLLRGKAARRLTGMNECEKWRQREMKNRTEDETMGGNVGWKVTVGRRRRRTEKKMCIGNEWRLLKWHAGHGMEEGEGGSSMNVRWSITPSTFLCELITIIFSPPSRSTYLF